MSDIAIRVENLSKQYRIGGPQARYKTIRESLTEAVRTPFRRLSSVLRGQSSAVSNETIWALKDVSFEVKRGEIVGIIGRNGAGKSTLLKILSRITEPTDGRAEIHGRVGSLLEVGTGFHPELTGRENIYLNGAILGMKRAEIERKFDEIVDFAEIERFLDTPVKHYSSGMYVRLAFAVAVHLEPEVLLVDEVLAVGDAAFQKKCLGKMGDVAGEGRTVLFVSHNMEAIRRLCPRAMLISDGRILLDDSSATVVDSYLSDGRERARGTITYDGSTAAGDEYVRLKAIRLVNREGHPATVFDISEGLSVEIGFTVLQPISNFHTYIRVVTREGAIAFGSGDWDDQTVRSTHYVPGKYVARCIIPGDLLNRGIYFLRVEGVIPHVRYVFELDHVLSWEITEVGGAGGSISSDRPGVFRPRLKWDVSVLSSAKGSSKHEILSL